MKQFEAKQGLTWVDSLPVDWEVTKVKFISKVTPGATPKSSNSMFWDGDIPFVTPADYTTEDHYIEHWSKTITNEGMDSCSTSLLPPNSVIVSNRAPIGLVALNKVPVCTNQGCKGLIVKSSQYEPEFLYRVLTASEEALNALGNGTTYQELSGRALSDFVIPNPSLDIQRSIVAFLDSRCKPIDEAIARHRSIIGKLEDYRRAVISHTVSGDSHNLNSAHWTWKRFKFIAHVDSSLVEPDSYQNWLHISPESIGKGNGRLLHTSTVSEDGVISGNHLFHKGAILYSKVRPRLNKVVIAPAEGLCSADMYPISTSQFSEWLKYYMLSDQFVEQAGLVSDIRIKMPKINQQELGDLKIFVPTRQDQLEIISQLDYKCAAIDEGIDRQEQAIAKLEEYRRSLIFHAVTGRIDCAGGAR